MLNSIALHLLTPQYILEKETHEQPFIIFLEDFKSFDDLLKAKMDIRDLKLVPIKTDEMQKKYHSIDKDTLMNTIQFGNSNFLFLENQFPYMLPTDVAQNIIWIKEGTNQKEVIRYIDDLFVDFFEKRNGDFDLILFERPFGIKTKLVKGSFPFVRHIHFWYKKL